LALELTIKKEGMLGEVLTLFQDTHVSQTRSPIGIEIGPTLGLPSLKIWNRHGISFSSEVESSICTSGGLNLIGTIVGN
jgi:hypothetical protein